MEIETDYKSDYKISEGVLTITATLPSGATKSQHHILQVLMMKCTSFHDLEYKFTDDDNKEYYFHL